MSRIVPFDEMRCSDFSLKNPSALKQDYWDKYKVYSCLNQPKPDNTFLLINDCKADVLSNNGSLTAKKGDLLYMPKGAEYRIDFNEAKNGDIHSIVLHFDLFDENGEEFIFSGNNVTKFRTSIDVVNFAFDAAEEFNKKDYSPSRLHRDIYGIIYEIFQVDSKREVNKYLMTIEKGVELLSDSQCDLSISEIAKICMVSECYFRRLFYKCYGKSPVRFRNECRVEQAKKLLMSDVLTVTEVSQMSGFSDVYYFSKVFKSITGVSPKNYM